MKTKNIKVEILSAISPFLERLKSRPEVLGIILLGGLGKRNFMDSFSDVDLSIITDKQHKYVFPLPFEFHYKRNDNWLEFNVHQLIFEDEEKMGSWTSGKIEAYMNAVIYYDTDDKVKNLLHSKLVFDKEQAFNRLVWILQQYKWRGQIHSIRTFYRGYPGASHDLINNCSELLLEAIYLLNEQYMPHKKWALVFLNSLQCNYNLMDKFESAMIITGFDLRSIEGRIDILNEIYDVVSKAVYEKYDCFPKDPYEYYYRNCVQINNETLADKKYFELTGKHTIETIQDKELFGNICFELLDI